MSSDSNTTDETPGINYDEHPLGPPPSRPVREKKCKVYNREEWGAVEPLYTSALPLPVKKVVVSRIEMEPCFTFEQCSKVVKQMQTDHMKEGAPDIWYNFLIGGDGALYEGRGYEVVGPTYPTSPKQLETLNRSSIDIALITQMSKLTHSYFENADNKINEPASTNQTNQTSRWLILIKGNEASEPMLKAVVDCITIGAVARFIAKTFDIYWVANNEIQHVEYGMGEQQIRALT